jgi:RNA polymerase sigma-70 factor (ECF subfamily)
VATRVLSRGSRFASQARPALVNGTAGLVVGPRHRPFAVVGFTVAHDRIVAIDLITNPDKLRGLVANE